MVTNHLLTGMILQELTPRSEAYQPYPWTLDPQNYGKMQGF